MSVTAHKSKIPVFQGINTKKPTGVQKRLKALDQHKNSLASNERSDFTKPKLPESKFTKAYVKSLHKGRSVQPVVTSTMKVVQKVRPVLKSSAPTKFKGVQSSQIPHTVATNAGSKVKSFPNEIKSAYSRITSPAIGVQHTHDRDKLSLTEAKLAPSRVKLPLTQVKSPITQVKSSLVETISTLTEVKSPLTEVKLAQNNIYSIQANGTDSVGVNQDDQDIEFAPDQKALESILNNQGIVPDFKTTTPKAMSGFVSSGITPVPANRMSMWDSYREFKINLQKHKAMLQHLNIDTSFEPDSKALNTILNGQGISSIATGMCNRSSMYTSTSRTMMQSYLDHKENIKLLKETMQQAEKVFVTPHKGVGTATTTTPLCMGRLTPAQHLSSKKSVNTPAHRIAFPALAEENEVTPDKDQTHSQRLEKMSNFEQRETLHSNNNNPANNVLSTTNEMYSKSISNVPNSISTVKIHSIPNNTPKDACSTQKSTFTPNQVSNASVFRSSLMYSCNKTNSTVNPLRHEITNDNQQLPGSEHSSTTAHYRKELFPTSRGTCVPITPSPNRKHLLSRTPITGSAARVPVKNYQTPTATGIKAPPMRTPILSSCLKNRDVNRTGPEMVSVSATKTLRWADGHRLSQNS